MIDTTSFDAFEAIYAKGKPGVVSTRLVADLETPVSTMLKIAADRPYSFLLESVEGGSTLGRYSIIGLKPDIIWKCLRGEALINRDAADNPEGPFLADPASAMQSLRDLLAESSLANDGHAGLPPMASGLFGYLGYDMIRVVEAIPETRPDTLGLPDAILMRPTVIVIFDSLRHDMTLYTVAWPSQKDSTTAYKAAIARLDEVENAIRQPLVVQESHLGTVGTAVSSTTRERFEEMVRQAKEYIASGDIFQVVPSHRFSLPYSATALTFYRALRRLNPSPFLFMLNFGAFAVIGSSPEIMVRVRAGEIAIRPLAGTRKRGATPDEDRRLGEELLADEKERAEHLMLLDLGRNDVGRVAEIGSVRVTERMVLEHYSHVMHIVSHVTGRLRRDADVIDAMLAGFPAGTVSGAPKIRAMQIIDELETERRGVYGGCIGYFGATGDMDTCIALRTAVLKDNVLYVQAGAGVVADSNPASEYEETCNKAEGLLKAAQSGIR